MDEFVVIVKWSMGEDCFFAPTYQKALEMKNKSNLDRLDLYLKK